MADGMRFHYAYSTVAVCQPVRETMRTGLYPHRPFIGSNGPDDLAHGDAPSRWIKAEEVIVVPGFLEELPEIRHHFADGVGEQAITVTMLAADSRERLERKVLKARGEGEIEATFAVPAAQFGRSIKFAAFVGADFTKTPQHIQRAPMTVK